MAEIQKKATRESYGEALCELAEKYPDIVVLDADLAAATKTAMFKKKYPERFFDCGISECNMMGVAAGLANTGKIPFASTFAMFAAGRAFEIIRNSIGYPELNVKIGATHAGITVGEDGATHQCNEDIALMRVIPGMTIINPADDVEAKAAVEAAVCHKGPVYLRFGRLAAPVIYNKNDYKFTLGKGILLQDGTDVTIIASGLMVSKVLEADRILKESGIKARIIDMHTIKPIDRDIIIESAEKTNLIFTVEEHSIIGGLGSAVSEVVCESSNPVRVHKIGINDVYGCSGPAAELLDIYGLTGEKIAEKIKKAL